MRRQVHPGSASTPHFGAAVGQPADVVQEGEVACGELMRADDAQMA